MALKYLLDTNICIELIRSRHEMLVRKVESCLKNNSLAISSVTCGESYFGAEKSRRTQHQLLAVTEFIGLFKVLDFGVQSAAIYGKIRLFLEKKGQTIGPYDMQIASVALAHGLILVTDNVNGFNRVSELKVENWIRSP